MLLFLLALSGGPGPGTIDQPRRSFSACVKTFETTSLKAKMMPDDYAKAVRGSCPAEAAALKKVLVAFDVGMGTKRAAAETQAQLDVEDYFVTSEDHYRASVIVPK